MARLVALVAVVAALAATPAAALAQENPFLPPPQQQPEPAPAPAPVDDDSGGDGDVSATGALVIGLVVVLLIGGIWFGISRDARRNAPRRERQRNARTTPDADERRTPGAAGQHKHKSPRHRKPSRAERERRKRGRAR